MTVVRWLLVGLVVAPLLSACGSKPPPPTIVQLTVKAAANINPDADNRPSPVVLRAYQLAATDGFDKADFFQLYEKDAATLGADMADRQEIAVAPGASKTVTLEFKPNAKFLGVIVAFRGIDRATWRADTPVPANKTTSLTATIDALSVKLAASGSQ
jgi:type VI secretion system protein VasD